MSVHKVFLADKKNLAAQSMDLVQRMIFLLRFVVCLTTIADLILTSRHLYFNCKDSFEVKGCLIGQVFKRHFS